MRVTVCELPQASEALEGAWSALCRHCVQQASELVLLPELAFVDPFWEAERFDVARWEASVALSEAWLRRLPELQVPHVIGARPARVNGHNFNQGFHWTPGAGIAPLRNKVYLPEEPGGWEARWFERGDAVFPAFRAGDLAFGLNICTELWALETYAAYANQGVHAVLAPRATARTTTVKWLSVGLVAAVRSGAYCLSSNQVDRSGNYGGVGWIIDPQGRIVASTTPEAPFATADIDLAAVAKQGAGYPRYALGGRGGSD